VTFKNILKTLLFLLIGFLLFWFIQPFYLDRGEVLRWGDFQDLEDHSLDVVFLGSSHAYHSFNPEIIDDLLPIESFALGIPGDNLPILYHEIREVLHSQSPRVIAIDTFTFHISHWRDGPYVYRFLNTQFNARFFDYAVQILFPNNYTFWKFFPAFRNPAAWREDKFITNLTSRTVQDYEHNAKGFAPLEKVISNEVYEEMFMEELLPQPKNYLQNLDKIIDLTRKNEVDLLFFDTLWFGFRNGAYNLYDPSLEYERIAEEGYPYLDFRTQPRGYDWQQIHFFDVDHPSTFGSLILSVHMAKALAEQYDLPVDEQKLAYYETYFFKEHHIHETGAHKTIEIIPVDKKAPLYYAWSLTCQEQVMREIDYSVAAAFEFEPCQTGESEIQVKVWNPDGNYVLKANFIVPAEE